MRRWSTQRVSESLDLPTGICRAHFNIHPSIPPPPPLTDSLKPHSTFSLFHFPFDLLLLCALREDYAAFLLHTSQSSTLPFFFLTCRQRHTQVKSPRCVDFVDRIIITHTHTHTRRGGASRGGSQFFFCFVARQVTRCIRANQQLSTAKLVQSTYHSILEWLPVVIYFGWENTRASEREICILIPSCTHSEEKTKKQETHTSLVTRVVCARPRCIAVQSHAFVGIPVPWVVVVVVETGEWTAIWLCISTISTHTRTLK